MMVPLRFFMVEGEALELESETLGNHVIFHQILQHASEICGLTTVLHWREWMI